MSEGTQDSPPSRDRASSAVGPIVMAAALCAVTGYMIIDSLGYPFRVKLGPLTFSGATFVLAVVVLVNEIVKYRCAHTAAASDTEPQPVAGESDASDDDLETRSDQRVTRPELVAFGWLAAIVAAFFLLGFMVGMPLFMLALMRVYGREPWRLSIAVTAGVMVAVYLLFIQVLNVPVYSGILPRYLFG